MSFIKRETKNFIQKFMHVFNGEKKFSECKLMKSRCSVKFMRRFEKNGSLCDCCSLFLNGFTIFFYLRLSLIVSSTRKEIEIMLLNFHMILKKAI